MKKLKIVFKTFILIKLTPVIAKGTSFGWFPSAGEGILKHCEAVSETGERSRVAITKPSGLSEKSLETGLTSQVIDLLLKLSCSFVLKQKNQKFKTV